jgi:hypothetical protein
MSDQLLRLLEKLELEIGSESLHYFSPKDISLLQWIWQNFQMQEAGESDATFVQKCMVEQEEKIAAALVDIMVEAESKEFTLPNAKPSIHSLCEAIIWWGQQQEWAMWLEGAQTDLQRLAYTSALPTPNYSEEKLAPLKKWLNIQKGYEELAIFLISKSKQLECAFPKVEIPYDPEELAAIESELNVREQLWYEFDLVEGSAAAIGWTIKIPASKRTDRKLESFRAELRTQKGLRDKVLVMNKQLSERGVEPIDCLMPLELSVVEHARQVLDFQSICAEEIVTNTRLLLPWHRGAVRHPSSPFERESFSDYQLAIAPYIKKASFLRQKLPLFIGLFGVLTLILYQSVLYSMAKKIEQSAREIEWELEIDGPFYSYIDIQIAQNQLDESLELLPVVQDIEKNYRLMIEPPYSKDRVVYIAQFHERVKQFPASRFYLESGDGPYVIQHFFVMTDTEITSSDFSQVLGQSSLSDCGPTCPEVNVTWREALVFANALSIKMGLEECYFINEVEASWPEGPSCKGWRLPTEFEWVYAASGGGAIAAEGWGLTNSQGVLHPVAKLQATPSGLYDIKGNAAEWVWDGFGPLPNGEQMDYAGVLNAEARVVRGGSWLDELQGVQRKGLTKNSPVSDIGFRLVRTLAN